MGLFSCIFSEYFEFADKGAHGIDALAVAHEVVVGEVYIEQIFPFAPDDGKGLYLGEVDFVEREDAELKES